MKKIIYLIIITLILSVVFVSMFPTWFLKDAAGWTYLSDTARVDVAFVGNVKNSRVSAEGAGLRMSQPAWFSDETYQGTVIEFPVSYRSKSYKIKIAPHAAECGEDTSLVLTFRGADIRENGKRMPAWVTFRNIVLNGQTTARRQKVWHDKPFILKFPPQASEIALSFDVHKPFSAKDISFTRTIPTFIALLLLSLFFSPLKRVAAHALILTNRKDIVKVISDGYHHIDPVYRRSFWIIFGVLCFAFGFHTIYYMWGNHDWSYLDHNHRWLERAWLGRYMASSVKVLLSGGVYLPLMHDLIIFLTLALNAVLLCKYWRLEKRVVYYVLCGLVLTAQPFTLSMVYFVNMTPEVFIGVTCALTALILSEKVSLGGGSVTKKIVFSLIAIVLINFSLGTYPVLLNTIAVAFVGRLLIQSLDWDGSCRVMQSYLRTFAISAINVVLGITLYKLVITYVFPIGVAYSTRSLSLDQMPERLGILLKQCVNQLYEYNLPFLHQWTLWVFLGFTILLALHICSTGSFKQKVVRLSLLFGSLFATQTAMLIAEKHLIAGRIELFGLVVFEVLVMTIVISKFSRQLRNLWVITGSCVVFSSVISDLDCLRVWKLGFDAEKMLWNRVLVRLETQKGFEIGKRYDVVQIGYHISLRPHYYTQTGKQTNDIGLLNFAFDPDHAPFDAHQSYYHVPFLGNKRYCSCEERDPEYIARLKHLYQAGVLQRAEVWPRPNGLIVWKDIILFVTDGKKLARYKKRFERELGKE